MTDPVRVLLCASLGRVEIVAALKEMPGVHLTVAPDTDATIRALAQHDVLMCPNPVYTAPLAAALGAGKSGIKWLQLLTAGYDALQEFGVPREIVVTGAGDAYAPAVATHAISLMLALERRLVDCVANKEAGRWDRAMSAKMSIPFGGEVLIVGFGSIGAAIARIARAMSARIVAVTRRGVPNALADTVYPANALADVLPRADAVILALPLSAETRNLIGAKEFARMKRGAVLVNIARGALVDTAALAAALNDGTLAGAGLDVTEPEPLPAGHPLWAAPNLIITPHVAGSSGPIGGARLADVAVANLKRYMRGDALAYAIGGLG
ncbi:MAG TPA: D-2-hydroxyacid dehydrogenase [Stellaceae bacterium]|nr:D-2-hydroxyacid dehydrogenase [Stellaceae bacterium]